MSSTLDFMLAHSNTKPLPLGLVSLVGRAGGIGDPEASSPLLLCLPRRPSAAATAPPPAPAPAAGPAPPATPAGAVAPAPLAAASADPPVTASAAATPAAPVERSAQAARPAVRT